MRQLALAALLVLPFGLAHAGESTVYGEAMPEGEAIDIAAAASDPEAYAGEPRLFSGRITQVCQKKGCWVVLEQDGKSARVMAKDHGFEVPKDSSGPAVAYGVLQIEPITPEHARHLVEDDGAEHPGESELRVVATAIRIGG